MVSESKKTPFERLIEETAHIQTHTDAEMRAELEDAGIDVDAALGRIDKTIKRGRQEAMSEPTIEELELDIKNLATKWMTAESELESLRVNMAARKTLPPDVLLDSVLGELVRFADGGAHAKCSCDLCHAIEVGKEYLRLVGEHGIVKERKAGKKSPGFIEKIAPGVERHDAVWRPPSEGDSDE